MFINRKSVVLGGKSYLNKKYAVEFDGDNDYIDVARDSDLDAGISPFAISIWINSDSISDSTNTVMVGKGLFQQSEGDNKGWTLGYTTYATDKISFQVHHYEPGNQLRIKTEFEISESDFTGKWQHIVATRTTHGADSHYTVYVNGIEKAREIAADGSTEDSLAADKAIDDNTHDFKITGTVSEVDGKISDVAYYKGELNASNILEIYEAGNGAFDHNDWSKSSDLVLWWRMGDGTENGTGSTIYDMSSNSYNGTARNDAAIVEI